MLPILSSVSYSETHRHSCISRPPPTRLNNQNTHTHSPPSTPPTITTSEEWSACGEVVVNEWEGKWRPRRGDTLLLLTLRRLVMFHIMTRGIRFVQGKLMGTCVLRGPRCGNTVILLGRSQIAPSDRADVKPAIAAFSSAQLSLCRRQKRVSLS